MTTDPRAIGVAGLIALTAVAIAGFTIHDLDAKPASSAAHNTAKPSAQPQAPVPQPKPVEKSPPVDEVVPGDGTWVIGKEIKRGTYRTEGGSSCYWARSIRSAGHWVVIDSAFGPGVQEVVLGKDDVAFDSQGCDKWVMVR